MPYRFGVGEPIDSATQRILSEEIDKAGSHITAAAQAINAVHAARKSLKRARALVVLAKPLVRGKSLNKIGHHLRDISHNLSGARDGHVVVEAASLLEADCTNPATKRLLGDVRSWLQARREKKATLLPSQIEQALSDLGVVKALIPQVTFRECRSIELLASVQKTYAEGRAMMSDALESEDAEALHEWRKRVQRHWRHMSLLTQAWPSETKARTGLAHALSETLGHHHDLELLKALLLENRSMFSSPDDTRTLCAVIDNKQTALASRAAVQGERLYAEKPKAFLHRFGRYWAAAEHAHDASVSASA